MKAISGKKMKELQEKRTARFVDVDTEQEYQKNHIKGAINIPYNEKNFVQEFKNKFTQKDEELILAGKNQQSKELKDLSSQLEKAGYQNVKKYQADPPEWRESNLSVKQQV